MAGNVEKRGEQAARAKTVRMIVVLSLVFFSSWALNQFSFPVFDTFSMTLRDTSSVLKGFVLVAVAIVASKAVSPFATKSFFGMAVGTCAAGCALLAAGVATGNSVLAITGALVGVVGSGFSFVLVGIACLDMDLPRIGGVLAGGLVLSYVERVCVLFAPLAVGALVPFIAYLVITLLVRCDVRAVLASAGPGPQVRDAQIIRPASFISFGNQIFVCLLVFRFIYGIALTLGEADRTPIDAWFSFVPVACTALYVWWTISHAKPMGVDPIFRVASLVILAGLLVVPAAAAVPAGTPNALMYAGSSLFDLVSWYVLIAIGSRNRIGAVAVFAWGSAMMAFGVVLGANVGRAVNWGSLAGASSELVTACVALAFMCYVVFFVSHHRFAQVIMSIEPVSAVEQPNETADFSARCAVVSQRFRLTPRETEIFNLLARGRNGHFVQNELVISYNTVKTHVAHIYDKLGVHTQQELIDLVDKAEAEPESEA